MLGGGINNIDIINASQSEARSKLRRMAGIKDSPSGILASSTELMNAVGSAAAPAMPVRATGPATPMTPAPVQQAQVALPQVPAPTAMPAPVQQPVQQAPAPRPTAPAPTVPQPAAPTTPMKFQPGGPVAVNEQFRGYSEMGKRMGDKARKTGETVVDITQDPMMFLQKMDKETGGAVTEKYGSTEAALKEAGKKVTTLDKAAEATKDPKELSDTVMVLAEVEPTDENKKDFATNVLGLEDVNDIDEINNRIAEVALYSSIGGGTTGTDKLAKALMLGLNNYKQTASARAAGAAAAAGKASDYTPERLRQRTIEAILKDPDQFNVYNDETGQVDPVKVQQQADILVRSMQQTPVPQTNSLPTISTEEEYNALPSGAEFMQNGQKRRKP